ncbi:serine/threonine-protein kinase [Nocardioides caeni]|uniref:non-specific serine/threonine protein kinase n=1 Tax=Nocardioides caeni TaxID=574700 RepID=A0A4S8N8W4_9ACTN|nr:serine/threonine-protein kinase [Nocardioides caeni]THV12863.1 serine/threonine protein kinase [Nocardioides caeni]
MGMEPRVGDRLGRYELVEVLGRGGMGTVFRARDTELHRDVAVKVINAVLAGDDEFRERFLREAVVLSQMDSNHVVAVHDHGEQDGSPYLVTQLVRGGDLLALLRAQGSLEPSYALDLAGQVLEGLADAHAIGVVHRDVKPSNVLLREDRRIAYLCDFGIATSPGRELTRTGGVVGSTAYMAPERHAGDTGGATAVAGDVYAAGCLLWTMLTGSQPYVGTDAEVAMGHLRAPVPQLPGRSPFLDRLNALLRRSLAKDPRQRYVSARAMAADVAAVRHLVPGGLVLPDVTAVRQSVDLPKERPVARRVLVTAVVGALVATGVYVGSLLGGVEMVPSVLASDDTTPTAAPPTTPSATQPSSTATRPGTTGRDSAPRTTASATGQGVVRDVDEGSGADGERAPDAGTGGGAQGSGPRDRPGSASTPRATATATATVTAAPAANYRCWNGVEVIELASCSKPTGRAGANWVFPGAGSLDQCRPQRKDVRGFIEGYICERTTGDGTVKSIAFSRWTSKEAAEAYVWGRTDPGRNRANDQWAIDGVVFGRKLNGWTRSGYAHNARIYRKDGIHWALMAQGRTVDKRASMFGLVGFRTPSQLLGVPIG